MWTTLLTAIALAADASPPLPEATAERPQTKIRVVLEEDVAAVDVTCPFGIDRATLKRGGDTWPKMVKVRLHLRGLESFQAVIDNETVEWAVASTGEHETRMTLHSGERVAEITRDSPYFSAVQVIGGKTIPLDAGGYLEVTLPKKLFEKSPREIQLRWIDFYRK